MKKKMISAALAAVCALSELVMPVSIYAEEKEKEVEITFTHDVHSYLDSRKSENGGTVGGLARVKTFLDEKREENPDLLVLDGGDFSMGTLYQSLFETEAAELRLLGELGYDAVTFGNHEFDYGTDGLTNMFLSAAPYVKDLPEFVVCNMDFENASDDVKAMYEAGKMCNLKEYAIIEKGDVKIAVTGVFGKDALKCAPTCEVPVLDQVESVKKCVEKIKKEEDPDMIVCVSHSGTCENSSESEDEILAKEVPDLDLIVSGHTHTDLEEPIQVGNCYVVSCGCYSANVGDCTLSKQADGTWKMTEYEVVPMDDSIADDETILKELEHIREIIDETYLADFGLKADEVLAENDVEFEDLDRVSFEHDDSNLGDILSDAYRYAARKVAEKTGKEPYDIAVAPSGTIRGTVPIGDVTVSDAFEILSLGKGADQTVGYPLICAYFTGKELKSIIEVDASLSDMMTTARLYMSGLSFQFNPHRLILNKATNVWLEPELRDDTRVELEDDKLYSVVTDLYSGRMIGAVTDLSKGLIPIEPKDADGNLITDLNTAIIHDENGKELKAWNALAEYLSSFEKKDGISQVPEYYGEDHGRKEVIDSRNPIELVKNPNKFFFMIIGIVIAAIAILVLFVILMIRLVKRIRKKRKQRK